MSKNTIIKIAGLILMLVSFIAFIAKAPAFPIGSENLLPWSVWFLIAVLLNIVVWGIVMRLMTFALAVIWFFALIATWVPSTSTATGPVTELDWSDPDAVVEIGASIFNTKGQCAACHTLDTSAPKGRCPDLTDIGVNAANRVAGMDAKAYLIESLYDPSKYLVPGYGKIMPAVWKKPIELTKLEIAAVIAFLQSQGGEIDPEPFDEPKIVDRTNIGTTAAALPPLLTGNPEAGRKVFIDQACISCHVVEGVENPKAGEANEDFEVVTAPELTEIAAFNEVRYLEESILKPHAQIVSGYGTAKIRANGTTYEGTIVSQDNEKVVIKTKAADGTEEEHTILFSEFDEEPVSEEDIVNLKAEGFFTLTITPKDSNTPVTGEIIEESTDTVTLKIGEENQTFSKTDVKKMMTLTIFDADPVTGEYVSGTKDDEFVLIVDGNEEIIDGFDVEEEVLAVGSGKRLLVKSPMPDNFPDSLSVTQMADLVAFLSTLTGTTEEETTENTDQSESPDSSEQPTE